MKLQETDINDAPCFDLGEKVRTLKIIRNDGTFPGLDRGVRLAEKGEEGYVISIGTFLQQSYIYSVHFLQTGRIVGCLRKEIESVDKEFCDEEESEYEYE